VNKYLEGESSLEEEIILKDYFSSEDIDDTYASNLYLTIMQ
jgi:hypothetical protein